MRKLILVSIFCGISTVLFAGNFKAPGAGTTPAPEAPFILGPDEKVATCVIADKTTVKDAQAAISAARTKAPDTVLIIRLEGELVVESEPLHLSSREMLYFAPGGKMIATVKVPAMILVKNAELVGIAGRNDCRRGMLDGRGLAQDGILIENSAKVNITFMNIRDCTGDAVKYIGRGVDRYGEPGSLTGCWIVENGGNGLYVRNSAQFMCYNNTFLDNRRAGIDAIAPLCVIADNSLDGNQIGVFFGGADSTVARNAITGCKIGIKLGGDSEYNLITYNRLEDNRLGVHVHGKYNSIYYNDFVANDRSIDNGSYNESSTLLPPEKNIISCNRNVSLDDFMPPRGKDAGDVYYPPEIGNNLYFNPPTRSNPHKDKVVAGMGRHDIEIIAGDGLTNVDDRPRWSGNDQLVQQELEKRKAMDLSEVQKKIDLARKENPDDYLVVHLYGVFVASKGDAALVIPDYVSVIMHNNTSMIARFTGNLPVDPELFYGGTPEEQSKYYRPAIVSLQGDNFNSISGGTIDGGSRHHLSLRGIELRGKSISVIDDVTISSTWFSITTFGASSTGPRRKFYTMGRQRPKFIRGNVITGNEGSGIWGHMSENDMYIDNVITDNVGDGIAHDSNCHYNKTLFNTLVSNHRSGLWIELGAHSNILYGNLVRSNVGRHSCGIISYHGFHGRCRNNVIANNVITGHKYGIHLRNSSRAVVFGNFLENNQFSYGNDHTHTPDQDNYLAQNVFRSIQEINNKAIETDGFFAFPNRTVKYGGQINTPEQTETTQEKGKQL